MAIIKLQAEPSVEPAIYRFADVAYDARQIVDEARAEAAAILAEARDQADEIRRRAEQTGRQDAVVAAQAAAKHELQSRLTPLTEAIREAARQLNAVRDAWGQQWQSDAVQLAVKIAERVIRREVRQTPEITLSLVREALEMCCPTPRVRIWLHPVDAQSLGEAAAQIARELLPAAVAEIVGDDSIAAGGCRVETLHGEIDQRLDSQLARIEAELIGN